jgi:hypothetical protein
MVVLGGLVAGTGAELAYQRIGGVVAEGQRPGALGAPEVGGHRLAHELGQGLAAGGGPTPQLLVGIGGKP